jgi:hypothetical protein
MEAADQGLANIRMQLRFENREVRILAGQDPFFENALLHQLFEILCNVLKVMPNFILDTALGMTALVSPEPIAPASPGYGMKQVFTLSELAKPEIKNASAMPVEQHNGQQG